MGVREYDPALGRFTSADPIPGTPTDSQQLNRYPYVGNDPLSRYDLNGLHWYDSIGDAFKSIGEAAAGAGTDYLTGGTPALENDWRQGFSSMSTGQQVALIGGPVVAGGALVAAEYVGPMYAAYELGGAAAGAFGPEVDDLLGDEEAVCPDYLNNTVYQSIDEATGEVNYIGITNNLLRRATEQLIERGIDIDRIPGLENLGRYDARAAEQFLIERYGLDNLMNKINSISPQNPIYENAMARAKEILNSVGL